jgi:predicted transcriptional regulator
MEDRSQITTPDFLPEASRSERRIAQRILAVISSIGLTEGKIVEMVEGKKSTITSALRKLVAAGHIKRHGDGVRSCPFVYCKEPHPIVTATEEREWI